MNTLKIELLPIFYGVESILKEDLEKILNEYLDARRDVGTTSAPIAYYIRNDFRNHIIQYATNPNYRISASAGRGTLAKVPWLSINPLDLHLNVDVVYLFREDMSGVYICLRSFFYQDILNKYGEDVETFIETSAKSYKKFLERSGLLNDDLLFNIDLKEQYFNSNINLHKLGAIVAKFYDSSNIPSDDELINDLKYFLRLFLNRFLFFSL